MKQVLNKKSALSMLAIAAVAMIVPEFAHAAANVNNILSANEFKTIISFGLGIFAAWKWFQYFANFSPNSAFTDIIVPAIITFLAFKWQEALGWFGITKL